jgi:hypothetical protein
MKRTLDPAVHWAMTVAFIVKPHASQVATWSERGIRMGRRVRMGDGDLGGQQAWAHRSGWRADWIFLTLAKAECFL